MGEQTIIQYMRDAYSDEKLLALLEHTKSGKLVYLSCCCFAHFPAAPPNHKPVSGKAFSTRFAHYGGNRERSFKADSAFNVLASSDAKRRAKLLPLIKAEIKRRGLKP